MKKVKEVRRYSIAKRETRRKMVSEDMKLKFCPFCGGTARIKPKRRLSGRIYGYHLYHTCKHTNPLFTISSHGDVDSRAILISHWNRRCNGSNS